MLSHPEVVRKAQQHIDKVTSGVRLPTLKDRPNLFYIDCIVKEVTRYVWYHYLLWYCCEFTTDILIHRLNPTAPLGDELSDAISFQANATVQSGVPHAAITDDVHEGVFLPAGTIIVPNVWCVIDDYTVESACSPRFTKGYDA